MMEGMTPNTALPQHIQDKAARLGERAPRCGIPIHANAALRVMIFVVLVMAVGQIILTGRYSGSLFPLDTPSEFTDRPVEDKRSAHAQSKSTATSTTRSSSEREAVTLPQAHPEEGVYPTSHFCHSRDLLPDAGKRASCLFHHVCVVPAPADDSVHEVQWLYVSNEKPLSAKETRVVDASFTLGVGPHSVDDQLYFEPVLITPKHLQALYPNCTLIPGTSVLIYEYNAENFGHMLTDVLLPIYAALESFGMTEHPIKIFRYSIVEAIAWSCDYHIGLNGTTPWGDVKSHCARFYKIMSEMVLGHSPVHVLKGTTVGPTCFETLVVGTPMYSDDCLDGTSGRNQENWSLCNHGRQQQFWNFRNYVLNNVGASTDPPVKHKITITKRTDGVFGRDLKNFDEMVTSVRERYKDIEVVVVEWQTLSLKDQLELIRTTTVHVTPPGGVSFVALFLPRWATSIRLYSSEFRLEYHLFHYLGHITVEHVDCQKDGLIPMDETLRYIDKSLERYDTFRSAELGSAWENPAKVPNRKLGQSSVNP